jgi:serine/threonine protein kinase
MIKTNSGRSYVGIEDGRVVKVFDDKLMFLKEKFAYETFPELCAKVISIDNENMAICLKEGIVLRDLLPKLNESDNKDIKKSIINLLKNLHLRGYVHCDCHIDNIIVYPLNNNLYEVCLIDFEHLRCKSKDKFEEDIDIKGGSYICAFDNSPRSIKSNLGEFE